MPKLVPFVDLKTSLDKIRPGVELAVHRVLEHGKYIMGPEVFEIEERLGAYCGVKHVVSCSSGTDALLMVLMAKGVGSGDAIFVPSFTFVSTPEVVTISGAVPVFVDVDRDTFNMEPQSLEQAIAEARRLGLHPCAIISVDLFGQPANYPVLQDIAKHYGLWVLADAAQSFGGSLHGRKVGTFGVATATSFFPAKPLGCYGDGGAVFTDDDALCEALKSIRNHGQGECKGDSFRLGLNARMDTIQAAILLEKFKIFEQETEQRRQIAAAYNDSLSDTVKVPFVSEWCESAWAQYTIQLPENISRHKFMQRLEEAGIPSAVYYAKPLHLQAAYRHYPTASGEHLPVCEMLADRVLSLPIIGNTPDSCYAERILRLLTNAKP